MLIFNDTVKIYDTVDIILFIRSATLALIDFCLFAKAKNIKKSFVRQCLSYILSASIDQNYIPCLVLTYDCWIILLVKVLNK